MSCRASDGGIEVAVLLLEPRQLLLQLAFFLFVHCHRWLWESCAPPAGQDKSREIIPVS